MKPPPGIAKLIAFRGMEQVRRSELCCFAGGLLPGVLAMRRRIGGPVTD